MSGYWQILVATAYDQRRPAERRTLRGRGLTPADIAKALGASERAIRNWLEVTP